MLKVDLGTLRLLLAEHGKTMLDDTHATFEEKLHDAHKHGVEDKHAKKQKKRDSLLNLRDEPDGVLSEKSKVEVYSDMWIDTETDTNPDVYTDVSWRKHRMPVRLLPRSCTSMCLHTHLHTCLHMWLHMSMHMSTQISMHMSIHMTTSMSTGTS